MDAKGYLGLYVSVVWSVLGGKVSIGRYEGESPDLKIGSCWTNVATRFACRMDLFHSHTTPTMRLDDHWGSVYCLPDDRFVNMALVCSGREETPPKLNF